MTGQGVPRIVLTGGPCGGKTGALAYLREHLAGRGWDPLVVPEAATLLIGAGAPIPRLAGLADRDAYLAVQAELVGLQQDLLARFERVAAGLDRPVLLLDRAEPDSSAYTTAREWQEVCGRLGTSPAELVSRYDAVIHLVTAADGAAHAYTLANNEARTETPERAVELDRAVRDAWLGHPHLVVVGNAGGFDAKLARVLAAVLGALGDPVPVEIERKWLLPAAPPAGALSGAVPVEIEQAYLPAGPDGAERRVRARVHDGHALFFRTSKSPSPDGTGRVEREVRISEQAYRELFEVRDPAMAVVRKRRWCVVDGHRHFELDEFREPVRGWLLEAELVVPGEQVVLPGWADGAVEVTEDPAWKNSAVARRGSG